MIWMLLGTAMADLVMSPPRDCPPGSTGVTGHEGPHCRPDEPCDKTCKDGRTCSPVSLCVFEEERRCAGRAGGDPTCRFVFREALGTCTSDADCTRGTCVMANRCVDAASQSTNSTSTAAKGASPPASTTGATPPSSSACGTPGAPVLVGLLGLLPLALRRRR